MKAAPFRPVPVRPGMQNAKLRHYTRFAFDMKDCRVVFHSSCWKHWLDKRRGRYRRGVRDKVIHIFLKGGLLCGAVQHILFWIARYFLSRSTARRHGIQFY